MREQGNNPHDSEGAAWHAALGHGEGGCDHSEITGAASGLEREVREQGGTGLPSS